MVNQLKILLVEDSRADARLIMEVFKEEKIHVDVDVVRDGDAAMSYLYRTGEYENKTSPDLILLDLNMPRKDGREVLAEIKADERLKSIPVVILTTSQSEEDILKSYNLHASCYVAKPIDLDQFRKIIKSIDEFWFSAVRYPPKL
ncbi:MAG: response regulator [Candidatus Melainabacteria bacterium]|nr:response regulator [Candidatus Melainabacteria bacterium]